MTKFVSKKSQKTLNSIMWETERQMKHFNDTNMTRSNTPFENETWNCVKDIKRLLDSMADRIEKDSRFDLKYNIRTQEELDMRESVLKSVKRYIDGRYETLEEIYK